MPVNPRGMGGKARWHGEKILSVSVHGPETKLVDKSIFGIPNSACIGTIFDALLGKQRRILEAILAFNVIVGIEASSVDVGFDRVCQGDGQFTVMLEYISGFAI